MLLSALWLAAVHTLASLAVPTGLRAPVDAPSRVVDVAVTAKAAGDASEPARPGTTAERGLWALFGDEEFRPSAPRRLPAVDRTSDRSIPPLRSPTGLAASVPADLSLSLASVPQTAAHRVSHAVASRGGHLPYYPTAPPLQG